MPEHIVQVLPTEMHSVLRTRVESKSYFALVDFRRRMIPPQFAVW